MAWSRIVSKVVLWLVFSASIPCAAGDFFERAGVALDGYDPVSYFTEQKPVVGVKEFTAEYKGSVFHFASKANRDHFLAAPDNYAPQYDGFCAYGTAQGYKAKIDPAAFSIVDGKLYLNYNASVQKEWSKDRSGTIARADSKWPNVSKLAKVIP
ncbi:MAG: YHS domain-containing (seleno)protein [Casimicrobiaceae bacterium]